MKTKYTPRSGFTLIELLTVIAIIGILAAILIPTVGNVRTRAAQITSASNMKQIAVSFSAYANSGSRTRNISNEGAWSVENNRQAADQKDWAKLLAYHSELTDAGIWLLASDEDVQSVATLPRSIGIRSGNSFNETSEWSAMDADAISYVVVVNMSTNAPTSTPLLWTKGLQTDGTWEITSPWQGQGGHIAFMDGSTQWFDDLEQDENQLAPGSASGETSNTSDITVAIQTTSTTTTFPAVN